MTDTGPVEVRLGVYLTWNSNRNSGLFKLTNTDYQFNGLNGSAVRKCSLGHWTLLTLSDETVTFR